MQNELIGKFVGTWVLESWVFTDVKTGTKSRPWSGNAIGEFRFDAFGRAAVQMMRTDRPVSAAPAGPSFSQAYTPEQMASVMDGYVAYWANYTVDEQNRILNLDIIGSVRPDWVNGHQQRNYEFSEDGKQMTLFYLTDAGVHRLVWARHGR